MHENDIRNNNGWSNILAFEGGGVRGALSTVVFERLLNHKKDLIDKTKLVAGTSTGAIIAAAIAYNLPVEELVNIYSYENSKYIFTPNRSKYFRPEFGNKHLLEVIDTYFPRDLTLNDLSIPIIIVSFNLGTQTQSWAPLIYTNLPASPTGKAKVRDALLSSSAAPVTFPSHMHNVDGGIYANDPSLIALSYALSFMDAKLDKTSVLCLGTGRSLNSITYDTRDWGGKEWMFGPGIGISSTPIISMMVSANSKLTENLMLTLLNFNHLKVSPLIDRKVGLSDYEAIPYLKKVGATVPLNSEFKWLDERWK